MIKKLLTIFLFLSFSCLQAQNPTSKLDYRPPVDIPIYLSGTFGEMRGDHFHSGMDIRTQGREGLPVYAIADGYVSRAAVSSGGFGKALYLDHPQSGHTSVYGHLLRFAPEIAKWVKQQQYEKQSFSVNLLPDKNLFRVRKGDVIAYSGNSGSSGGPHLHFEIRDAATQEILNPLAYGFKMKDFIRPSISKMAIYPESETSEVNGKNKPTFFELQGWGEQHRLKDPAVIRASGTISFGISTNDTHNDTPNKNGVYSIELFVDGDQIFGFRTDRFAFDETRYINSMIDYGYYVKNKSRIIRSTIDPFNRLKMYFNVKQNGSVTVKTGDTLKVEYVVKDIHGNTSKLPFTIVGAATKNIEKQSPMDSTLTMATAGKPIAINGSGFSASFPADAFYKNVELKKEAAPSTNYLSDVITIGNEQIPVHKNYKLNIKLTDKIKNTQALTVVYVDKDKTTSLGGAYSNGWISVNTRKLGRFAVMADSVAPTLIPLNFKQNADVLSLSELKVSIKDDFSGIKNILPTLNGDWLLMDYDPKNNLLTYEVDERLKKGMNTLRIVVTDECNNKTTLEVKVSR